MKQQTALPFPSPAMPRLQVGAAAVDLFAGAGGFTTGAEAAGFRVVWAANHWPVAVETHALNHGHVAHVCQDLQQAAWERVPSHDALLASPCCQGHSRAKGRERPGSDLSRATAWAVVSCAEYHRPAVVVVENVADFTSWVLYPAWVAAMNALGYALAPHTIDSADCGVAQHRERLFIVCTRSKAPIFLGAPDAPHRAVREILDFTAGTWSQVDRPGRSSATLARVAAGRARFGERFVMPYYGSGSGLTGRSLDRPLGTVTTRDRWALVDGDRMRMLTVGEYRAAMGFPATYQLPADRPTAIHMLGNAVVPAAASWVVSKLLEVA